MPDPNSFFGSIVGRQEWMKLFRALQHYFNVTVSKQRSDVHLREEKAIIDILKNKDVTIEYLEEKKEKYTRMKSDFFSYNLDINYYTEQDDIHGNKRGKYVPEIVAQNLLSFANNTDPEAGPKIRLLLKDEIDTEINYLTNYGIKEEGQKGKQRKQLLEGILSKFIGAKRKVKGGMRTRKLRSKKKGTRRH